MQGKVLSTFIMSFTAGLMLILSACSVYTSEGRKEFEQSAPSEIQSQAYWMINCRELSTAETWVRSEFPNASGELIDLTEDYEIWKKPQGKGPVDITVLTKQDDNVTQSCAYRFESEEVWKKNQQKFIKELSNSLANEE